MIHMLELADKDVSDQKIIMHQGAKSRKKPPVI